MASTMDMLTQRVNPRLVIFFSILAAALVPIALAAELVMAVVTGKQASSPVAAASFGPVVQTVEIPPLSHYQEAVSKHELFRPPVAVKREVKPRIGIAQLAKNLELIGIIELDKMEAIIKDKRTRQTYYVNEGSEIDKLTVAKIEANKIILSYEDETHELQMV